MEETLYLIKKAKRGDAEAFAKLYGEIYESLYKFALYTLRNTADAEDAVGEAVADAFASMRKLRRDEAFRSWMFRILSNKCKDKLREYGRKTETLTEDLTEELAAPQEQISLAEKIQIKKLFFELAEEERMVVAMHVFGGYTSREIAAILQMNENTVRSKESRALKKLAGKLEA
jgi:RNA polymerase sigma-70 factor (ECF subfamily)